MLAFSICSSQGRFEDRVSKSLDGGPLASTCLAAQRPLARQGCLLSVTLHIVSSIISSPFLVIIGKQEQVAHAPHCLPNGLEAL